MKTRPSAKKYRRPEQHAWLSAKREESVQLSSKCGQHRGLGTESTLEDYYTCTPLYSTLTETRFLGETPAAMAR